MNMTTPSQAALAAWLIDNRQLLEAIAQDNPDGAALLTEFRTGPRTIRMTFDEAHRLLVIALVSDDGPSGLVAVLGCDPTDPSTFGRRLDDPMTDPTLWLGQAH